MICLKVSWRSMNYVRGLVLAQIMVKSFSLSFINDLDENLESILSEFANNT